MKEQKEVQDQKSSRKNGRGKGGDAETSIEFGGR